MKRSAALLLALALLGPAAGAHAQDPSPPPAPAKADFAAELAALQDGYRAALVEYQRQSAALETNDERRAFSRDATKRPEHAFLPRFRDLATRARGTDTGLAATRWAIQTAAGALDAKRDDVAGILDELATTYVASPGIVATLTDLAMPLQMLDVTGRDGGAARRALATIADKAPAPDARACALVLLADLEEGHDLGDEAKEHRAKVVRDYPGTTWATRAQETLSAREHLAVGKPAPDFEATDPAGKKWKLSELRGNVVALVFWGFW